MIVIILMAVKHSSACYSHVFGQEKMESIWKKKGEKLQKPHTMTEELKGTHRIFFLLILKMQSELIFIPLLCLTFMKEINLETSIKNSFDSFRFIHCN